MNLVKDHAELHKRERALARLERRGRLYAPYQPPAKPFEDRLLEGLETLWRIARRMIKEAATREERLCRVDLSDDCYPSILCLDKETGSARACRMGMAHIRNCALADDELRQRGLVAVHLDWDDDDYGAVYVEFLEKPVVDTISSLAATIKGLPPHVTFMKVSPLQSQAVIANLARLCHESGRVIRVHAVVSNDDDDAFKTVIAWDPPGGVLQLPPPSEWND